MSSQFLSMYEVHSVFDPTNPASVQPSGAVLPDGQIEYWPSELMSTVK